MFVSMKSFVRHWRVVVASLMAVTLTQFGGPPALGAAGPASAETITGVTLFAVLGDPRMLDVCNVEEFAVLAGRGSDGVTATFIRSVTNVCFGDEAEEYPSDMTNVTFKVAANLGRARLIGDVVTDGRRLHIDETFAATGPAAGPFVDHEMFRDPETGALFLLHDVEKQRFVEGNGTFRSDFGYLLRATRGTLSACWSGC